MSFFICNEFFKCFQLFISFFYSTCLVKDDNYILSPIKNVMYRGGGAVG